MSASVLNAFLLGGLTLGCALVGLFFARFLRDTADRFFGFLAAAFWLLTLHWGVLALTDPAHVHRPLVFLLRLGGFIAVIIGIIDKNRTRDAPPPPPPIPVAREVCRRE